MRDRTNRRPSPAQSRKRPCGNSLHGNPHPLCNANALHAIHATHFVRSAAWKCARRQKLGKARASMTELLAGITPTPEPSQFPGSVCTPSLRVLSMAHFRNFDNRNDTRWKSCGLPGKFYRYHNGVVSVAGGACFLCATLTTPENLYHFSPLHGRT